MRGRLGSKATRALTIQFITQALLDHYTEAEATKWMRTPHPQLEGRTAMEAIEAGQPDKVLAIIERLNDGSYV